MKHGADNNGHHPPGVAPGYQRTPLTGLTVAAFPTAEGDSVLVTPDNLGKDLLAEIELVVSVTAATRPTTYNTPP